MIRLERFGNRKDGIEKKWKRMKMKGNVRKILFERKKEGDGKNVWRIDRGGF